MPNIGPLELAIVLLIVQIVFGPKRLPGLGRQLGSGMREFKDSLTGKDKDGHEDRLSLVEHLDELRTRLIVCIAVFIAAFAICYWQNHWLLEAVNRPLQSTQNLNGKKRSKDPLEESARFEIRSGTAQKQAAQAFTAQSRYFAV